MRTLGSLDVCNNRQPVARWKLGRCQLTEVESTSCEVGSDGGVAAVSEGAGLATAEASDVVLVAAEVLSFGGRSAARQVSST